MRHLGTVALLVVLAVPFASSSAGSESPAASVVPPPTRRAEIRDTFHGVEIADAYRWLEDQDSAETRAWIDAQNAYTHAQLMGRPERKVIASRLAELMRVDHTGAPIERGGRYFLSKKKAADDLPILYVRTSLDGPDQVLIDPHTLSADHTTSVTLMDVSQDGKTLVYGIRRGGGDEVEMHVLDVDKRADRLDSFPRALYGGVSLTPDGSGFYYTWRTRETGGRIRFHAMGTAPESDREIFGAGHGPGDWIGADVSEDGRYLLISVQKGWASSDVYIKDLRNDGPITPIVEDLKALFEPWLAVDTLIMKTDWQAPRGRVVAVDLKNPSRDKWRKIVPQGPDAIQEISLAGGRLFVHTLHDVSSRIDIYSIDGSRLGEIKLPGLGSADVPSGRWGSHEAFYDFRSFTFPRATYRLDTATGESRVWARDVVPMDAERFEVRQVWYSSKDGTRVPMFVVHRKDLTLDGNRPATSRLSSPSWRGSWGWKSGKGSPPVGAPQRAAQLGNGLRRSPAP